MEFLIDDLAPREHTPLTYEVEIEAMHGDADLFQTFTVGPFLRGVEEAALTSFIETLDRMEAAYTHGRGGNWEEYGFQHVEGFESWFGEPYARDEAEYLEAYSYSNVPYETFAKHRALAEPIGKRQRHGYVEWPRDVTLGDEGLEADMRKYQVFFYDEFRVKYKVKVVKSDDAD